VSASKVEIANLALLRIGQRSIQSIDEQSNEAVYCRKLYDRTRRTVLRSHPWRFALKLQTLAQEVTTPPGYTYSYALPSDLLYVVEVVSASSGYQAMAKFERNGQSLWADEPSAQLRYVKNVEDPNEFDDLFVDAFGWRMAAELATPVAGKPELMADMMRMFQITLNQARAASGGEARKKLVISNELKDSRA
jgi:hypothetical protein